VLGYGADNVLQFQAEQRLDVDGDVGPKTRSALHKALVALTPARRLIIISARAGIGAFLY